jgi:hypothetical protein
MSTQTIPTLTPKPYRPRCTFGHGHCWIVLAGEVCQCSRCGTMSSNWAPHLLKETSWGKTFHLSIDGENTLCGAEASTTFGFNHHGERAAFDAAGLQDHYCKRCVKCEES